MAKRSLRELAHLTIRGAKQLVRDLDDGGQLASKPAKLQAAMASHTKLAATYTRKRDGATLDYVLAPYEVKADPDTGRTVLWATDHKHGSGQIHKFILNRLDVRENLTRAGFAPQWPTRPDSV
jgi:hypothetical protein